MIREIISFPEKVGAFCLDSVSSLKMPYGKLLNENHSLGREVQVISLDKNQSKYDPFIARAVGITVLALAIIAPLFLLCTAVAVALCLKIQRAEGDFFKIRDVVGYSLFFGKSKESEEEKARRKLKKEFDEANAPVYDNEPFGNFLEAADSGHLSATIIAKEEKPLGEVIVAAAWAKGKRPGMEDNHFATEFTFICGGQSKSVKLFGVCDGHSSDGFSGLLAAVYVTTHIEEYLKKALEETAKKYKGMLTDAAMRKTLKKVCLDLNNSYKGQAGTTATLALILNDNLWVFNVGDSRTILSIGEEVIQLSQDAKPYLSKFQKRIEKLGGYIEDDRVGGILGVARSFGDHEIKGVSAKPTIVKYFLKDLSASEEDVFLIQACDGVWDVAESMDVGEYVQEKYKKAIEEKKSSPLQEVAVGMIQKTYGGGSDDNISIQIVHLNAALATNKM